MKSLAIQVTVVVSLILAALLLAQVQNVPNTTFPTVRSLLNQNFTWLNNNKARTGDCPSGKFAMRLGAGGVTCISVDWSMVTNKPDIMPPTFSTHQTNGCYFFPDNSIFHADMSGAPRDDWATAWFIGKRYPITAATWLNGVVTATVASTAGIASGIKGYIDGARPARLAAGYTTGVGSPFGSANPRDTRVTITVPPVDQCPNGLPCFQYPVASDPGAYPGNLSFSIGPYGSANFGTTGPAMVLNTADATTPRYMIQTGPGPDGLDAGTPMLLESDAGPYPILPSYQIEGGYTIQNGAPDPFQDNHVLTLDTSACYLYEIFAFPGPASGPPFVNGGGAVWNLRSNAMRRDGWTSADAAGLPIWPFVLTRGQAFGDDPIEGPIRVTFVSTPAYYRFPATHFAASYSYNQWPPFGTWFRLRRDFDISGFPVGGDGVTPKMQKILAAWKKYGVINADNGGTGFITIDHSFSANDDSALVTQLHNLWLESFEVVCTACLQKQIDSYEVKPFTPVSVPRLNQVVVTASQTGLYLTVDGQGCYAPCQVFWNSNDVHTISAPLQTNGNIQYTFASWSDGGAGSHTTSVTDAATITATFTAQYTQPSAPTFSSTLNAVAPGTVITASTVPASCNGFVHISTTNPPTLTDPATYTINTPVTLYANVLGCPITIAPNSTVSSASFSMLFTDTFSGTGVLNAANWTRIPTLSYGSGNTLIQSAGTAIPAAINSGAAYIVTGQTFTRAQFSQTTVNTYASGGVVLYVLMDANGNGYGWIGTNLNRYTAGVPSWMQSCAAPAPGNTIRLESDGAGGIRTYINNVFSCLATDQTYTTGSPGVFVGAGGTINASISNYQAGNR
jgi:hypothetical protein